LLALSLKHDPFYAGTGAGLALGQWFAELWERFSPPSGTHLRRFHYQIVNVTSPPLMLNKKTYQNTEPCWAELQSASTYARHLGLVAPDSFVDRRNPEPQLHARYLSPPDEPGWTVGEMFWSLPRIVAKLADGISFALPTPEVTGYGYDQSDQPYHLEIWIEKSTMNDVLEPLCRRFGVNFVTSVGFQSITSAIGLLRRLAHIRSVVGTGKPTRVFYASDFDPAGLGMPVAVARHVEFYLDAYAPGADVKLNPLVLTKQQVIDYALPRIPIKDEDLRKGNFEDRHGEGAVELDALEALHPGELARIVREAIEPYRDESLEEALQEAAGEAQEAAEEAWEEATEDERQELAEIEEEARQICAGFEGQLRELDTQLQEKLAPLKERLNRVRQAVHERGAELEVLLPDRPEADGGVPDEGGWLFDSGRDYLDQLAVYKDFKKEEMESPEPECTCEVCGIVFTAKKANTRFCGQKCRGAARRLRKKPR
jgi:hypothetical protein